MTKLAGRSVGLQGRAYGDVFFFFFFFGGGGGEVPYIDIYTYIYIYVYTYCLLTCLAAVCSYAVRSLFFASGVCRRGGVSIYIYISLSLSLSLSVSFSDSSSSQFQPLPVAYKSINASFSQFTLLKRRRKSGFRDVTFQLSRSFANSPDISGCQNTSTEKETKASPKWTLKVQI